MAQRRTTIASILASAAVLAGAVLPGTAAATGHWHGATTESGGTVHPGHFKSTTTRQQVQAEAVQARRNAGVAYLSESCEPSAPAAAASGLTRQQVVSALLSETPQERSARLRAFR